MRGYSCRPAEYLFNSQTLKTSDGAAVSEENTITIHTIDSAEIMLFDLA